MDDVRELFDAGLLGRNVAAVLWVVTLVPLIFWRKFGLVLRSWRVMGISCLTGMAVLGGLIALNFNRAFVIFHEMFFVDNWSFDPRTNLMVVLLPTPFWENITAFIIIMFAVLLIALVVLSFVFLKFFVFYFIDCLFLTAQKSAEGHICLLR